jgi:hypothetical protein
MKHNQKEKEKYISWFPSQIAPQIKVVRQIEKVRIEK